MKNCIDHEVIVENTGGCASSIDGKVEHHQNMNNTARIKLLSFRHSSELWCFCYHYTIWIIYRLINRNLATDPIVSWYEYKNISYTISFTDLVILGWKCYIINSTQGGKELDPHTNAYSQACLPDICLSLNSPSKDLFFMGYSKHTKFIIYFDPRTRITKRLFIASLINMIY